MVGPDARVLDGVKVVELAGDPAGEMVGKLLAEMGADVVKVELPEGSPTRRIGPFALDRVDADHSLTFWYYNNNKRSAVVDYRTPEGRDTLRGLLDGADVLISTLRPPELRQLDLDLEDEDFDTLGGLLYHELGKVPNVGDEVRVDGALVTVLSTTGRRVRKVRVTKILPTEPAATNER